MRALHAALLSLVVLSALAQPVHAAFFTLPNVRETIVGFFSNIGTGITALFVNIKLPSFTTTSTTTSVETTTSTSVETTSSTSTIETTTTTIVKPTVLDCKSQLSKEDLKATVGVDYIYGKYMGPINTAGRSKCEIQYISASGLKNNVRMLIYKYAAGSDLYDLNYNDYCDGKTGAGGIGERACTFTDGYDYVNIVFNSNEHLVALGAQQGIDFDTLKALAKIVEAKV